MSGPTPDSVRAALDALGLTATQAIASREERQVVMDLATVLDTVDSDATAEGEHPRVAAARLDEAAALAELHAAEEALAATQIQVDRSRAERFRSDIDRFHRDYGRGVVKQEGETRGPLTSIRDEAGEVTALTTHDLATPTPTPDNRADLIREHRRRAGI